MQDKCARIKLTEGAAVGLDSQSKAHDNEGSANSEH